MPEATVKEFFESLEGKLGRDPSKLDGMDCTYQFRVGEEGYNVRVQDGKAAVSKGEAPEPNCIVTVAERDFLELLSGKLNPQMAFMMGKLKVAGDMGLALKLGAFLR